MEDGFVVSYVVFDVGCGVVNLIGVVWYVCFRNWGSDYDMLNFKYLYLDYVECNFIYYCWCECWVILFYFI